MATIVLVTRPNSADILIPILHSLDYVVINEIPADFVMVEFTRGMLDIEIVPLAHRTKCVVFSFQNTCEQMRRTLRQLSVGVKAVAFLNLASPEDIRLCIQQALL